MNVHIGDHLVLAGAPEDRRPAHEVGSDDIAAAIMRELRGLFPGLAISQLTGGAGPDDAAPARTSPGELQVINARPPAYDRSAAPVLVSGTTARTAGSIVAAAIDDDANPGRILRYAAAQAHLLRVPLRVVHVWTGRATSASGTLTNRHDQISDADRLLSAVLYDHLTLTEAEATEREILHDRDVARALIALSGDVSLVVTAARSGPPTDDGPLGDTVRALIGRTGCPVAVLPPCAEALAAAYTW